MKPRRKVLLDPVSGSHGKLVSQHLRSGLAFKYEHLDISEQFNLGMVFKPGVRLVFALNGITHLHVGSHKLKFESNSQFSSAIFPVLENTLGYKKFSLQRKKSELVLFLSIDWLKDSLTEQEIDSLKAIFNDHLRPFYFPRTPLIQQLLQRLCHHQTAPFLQLQQESLCVSLVYEALNLINPGKTGSTSERTEKLADKIDSLLQAGHNFSIKELAHQCHSNPTSIQRIFKQRHGTTIGAYQRRMQLETGHQALMRGASVIEAAQVSGYHHLQSFSDAFREVFGYLPKTLKHSQIRPVEGFQNENNERPKE